MNRRQLIAAALAVAIGGGAAPALAQQAKYTAKIGHLEAPTQPRHLTLEKVRLVVRERTGGEVDFQLFPSSQLGNARQMIEGTQFGSMEATVMPAAFIGGFNPVVSVLDIPYLIPDDRAAAKALREGPFGQAVLRSFDSRGLTAIAIWSNGRKSLTSSKPIATLDQLKGQKFRVMDSRILMEQFAAVGASAVPINFAELYTALQTGVVDGQENPLDTITTMKFFEVQKHLVVSEHGVLEDIVLFNPGWWNALPAGHRDAIKAAFVEAAPQMEALKEEVTAKALDQLKASGISVRVADAAERKAMREAMYPRARAAFLDRAKAEGEAVIKVYEAEAQRLGLN